MPAQKPNQTSFANVGREDRPTGTKAPWAQPVGGNGFGKELRNVDMAQVDVNDGDEDDRPGGANT